MKPHFQTRAILALAFALALGGCMSTAVMQPTEASKLHPGETVMLRLWSGEPRLLKIKAVEPDALVGEDARVPLKNIGLIYRTQIDRTKTTAGVVLATEVAIGIAAITALVIGLNSGFMGMP